jgi:tyrosyl-tRNA synthetase
MKSLIDILETCHEKCSKLNFDNFEEFASIVVCVVGTNEDKLAKRIFKGDEETNFIDFASELFEMSKSELRKLIKGGGLKVNNTVPDIAAKIKDLPFIDLGERMACVIKIGKNKFDFILK